MLIFEYFSMIREKGKFFLCRVEKPTEALKAFGTKTVPVALRVKLTLNEEE